MIRTALLAIVMACLAGCYNTALTAQVRCQVQARILQQDGRVTHDEAVSVYDACLEENREVERQRAALVFREIAHVFERPKEVECETRCDFGTCRTVCR